MDQAKPWYQDWRALAGALGVNCMGILVRSVGNTIPSHRHLHLLVRFARYTVQLNFQKDLQDILPL